MVSVFLAGQRQPLLAGTALHVEMPILSSQVRQDLTPKTKCRPVSSEGQCCDTRGKISCGTLSASGYRTVQISGQNVLVHRLVKFSFDGPPSDKLAWQVHHVDGNPSNDRLENLEYATHRQNICYAFQDPQRGSRGQKLSKTVTRRMGEYLQVTRGNHFFLGHWSLCIGLLLVAGTFLGDPFSCNTFKSITKMGAKVVLQLTNWNTSYPRA